MTFVPEPAAMLVLRSLRVGPFRFTPYGLTAAVGLLLAMALARRLAPRRGLDPEQVWDAGLFAVFSCFLASRGLLVVRDPRAFLRYPLLVLSLPSLTYGGIAVAALLMGLYLWRKHLPWRRVLDAFAASGAVLAAGLELGHLLDGSGVGMPTAVPWAVRDPFQPELRVHPVAAYGVAGSALLAVVWWALLARWQSSPGRVAGAALCSGGALAFALDLLTQPEPGPVVFGLELGELLALVAVLAGGWLWTMGTDAGTSRPKGARREDTQALRPGAAGVEER